MRSHVLQQMSDFDFQMVSESLRAKRSNPDFLRGYSLDCFVASLLATTRDTHPHSRGAFRPSYAHVHPPWKTEGAGKTGWPLHPGPPRKKLRDAR